MIIHHQYRKVVKIETAVSLEMRALYGTFKNAYIQLGMFERGIPFYKFKLALRGEWTMPAVAQIITDAWKARKVEYGLADDLVPPGFEPEPRKQREIRLNEYIIELNKGKKFRIREE